MEDVQDKVAFITGGASGIGLGMARAFVAGGMRVVMADIREDHVSAALTRFESAGQRDRVHGLTLDVTDRTGYARAADDAERVFGRIDILCNNAGIGLIGPLAKCQWGDWDWGIQVMITGVINGIQTILPRIRARREGGHVVNTSSMTGILTIPNASIYAMAKSAMVGLSEAMRGELAAENIGVSAFCPGPVQSSIGETGRTRPAQFAGANSGFGELERTLEQRPVSPLWMDALECGERVLAGIRHNDMYIFTQREFREPMEERCRAIMAAFPDEPRNEARAREIHFLLANPIYREGAARPPRRKSESAP